MASRKKVTKKKSTRKKSTKKRAPRNPFTAVDQSVTLGGLKMVVPEMMYDEPGRWNKEATRSTYAREEYTVMFNNEVVFARGTCGDQHCLAANKKQAEALRDFLNAAIDNWK